jgi:hypothetical protein
MLFLSWQHSLKNIWNKNYSFLKLELKEKERLYQEVTAPLKKAHKESKKKSKQSLSLSLNLSSLLVKSTEEAREKEVAKEGMLRMLKDKKFSSKSTIAQVREFSFFFHVLWLKTSSECRCSK